MRFVLRFLKAIPPLLWSAVVACWNVFLLFMSTTWQFVMSYLHLVNTFTKKQVDTKRKFLQYTPVRYLMRAFLWAFAPIVFLIVPVGFLSLIVAAYVSLDQLMYPTFTVESQFMFPEEQIAGTEPSTTKIGSVLFTSSYRQFERELDSFFSWIPDDMIITPNFDDTRNRQLGVRHASIELLGVLSKAITKLGSTDEESPVLVEARQGGFGFKPDNWFFPTSQDVYRDTIADIKAFQKELEAGSTTAKVNITNTDIVDILTGIARSVLEVPHGRLNVRNHVVPWWELNDRVYFAQGAAVVARDALVTMRYAFEKKIMDAGALSNIDEAISSLEGVVDFHPWWITEGDGDSMFADHRAKISRYYTDARARIEDVASAIQR